MLLVMKRRTGIMLAGTGHFIYSASIHTKPENLSSLIIYRRYYLGTLKRTQPHKVWFTSSSDKGHTLGTQLQSCIVKYPASGSLRVTQKLYELHVSRGQYTKLLVTDLKRNMDCGTAKSDTRMFPQGC